MTDDYTPTTSEVREVYAADSRVFHPERPDEEAEAYAEFDRWLDEYTRTVRAAALREAADDPYALIRKFAEEDIRSHEAGFMSGIDVGYRNGVEDRGRLTDA